jgi:heme/copper-type cytochrome/quinol oxidase subunit 1
LLSSSSCRACLWRRRPQFWLDLLCPLSTQYSGNSTALFVFAIHIMGISSIMGAINVIVTIFNLRAPGMG